jgi:hypothetical protein
MINLYMNDPLTLQANSDVQESSQQQVFLNDVGRQPETGPVEADIEVAVSVEVIRSEKDVQVSDGVDHHEKHEEDGGSGGSDEVRLLIQTFNHKER